MITLAEFKKIDMQVAKIKNAERVPQTTKLLKVTVEMGPEQRTLVAGLGEQYQPEELLGLQVIVVANLEPAVIRGVESNGMLLGVGCDDRDDIALVTINREMPSGSRVL